MGKKKNFSAAKLKGAIVLGLGLLLSMGVIVIFSIVVRAAGYNSNSGWAVDVGNGNTDMRAYSYLGYNASYNESFWTYHSTKDGDNYKPHMGDIIVYGCYPYGVDYFGGIELGTAHVEICVEDYNEETGNYGVIGGNMGNSFTSPYYLGSSVVFTYMSWNKYYQAAYGDRFIYNIWEVTNTDIAENIVYSANLELSNYNDSPDSYRQIIFSFQGERNWCDIFVSKTLQEAKEAPVKYGCLSLTKISDHQNEIQGNSLYSVGNAVYGLYSDYECQNSIGTLVTDENGNTGTQSLEVGTYYVKEVTASKGHDLDDKTYTAEILADQTTYIVSTESAKVCNGKIIINKKNGDEYENSFELSGAEFLISYYPVYDDSNPEKPAGSWTVITEYDPEKDAYTAVLQDELLYGTYVIEEIKAPQGYSLYDNVFYAEENENLKITDGKYIFVIDENNNEAINSAGYIVIAEDHPYQIKTSAAIKNTEGKTAEKSGIAVICDTVSIVNPNADAEGNSLAVYYLIGNLYDEETGEEIKKETGESYETVKEIDLGGVASGDFTMEFNIDNIESFDGRKIIVREKLYEIEETGDRNEVLVAEEKNTKNPDQTIYVNIVPEETTEEETTKPEETTEEVTTKPEETTEEIITSAEETTVKLEETTAEEKTISEKINPQTGDTNDSKKYIAVIFIVFGVIGSTALIIRKRKIK